MAQTEITYVGLGDFIAKRNEEGDLIVVGKATGEDLDLDRQICDGEWLSKAMPEWFRTGANVREQHSSIAAGVGLEIEQDGSDWYLKSEVVDPGTQRKVEKKVLRGYSIGIKNAQVIKDASAPGGRIVGGDIVEISLVDRPANPTAQIAIAKAVAGGALELVKSDAMDVTHPGAKDSDDMYPAKLPCPGCNALGEVTDNPGVLDKTCEICGGTGFAPEGYRAPDERFGNPSDDENHEIKTIVVDEPESVIEEAEAIIADGDLPNSEEALPVEEMKSLTIGEAKTLLAGLDTKKVEHDAATLESVRAGLIALMKAELDEMLSGEEDEICDVKELLCALELFLCWWDGETEEGETIAPFIKEEEEEEGDTMAYVNLGANADVIKKALGADATEDDKNDLRTELRKALGIEDEIIITKSQLVEQEEVLKSLKASLEEIKEMATKGGPALRQTATQANKAADAERLSAEAARLRQIASGMTNPEYKTRYLEKAVEAEADARRLLRN